DVTYTYSAVDAYGDLTSEAVLVVIDNPDAVVLDDGLSGAGLIIGLTRAGSYTLTARVAAGGPVQTAALDVTVASGQRFVDMVLTLSRMAVDDTVQALTVVRDQYGNVINTPAPTYTIEGQGGGTGSDYVQSGAEFTIARSGVYKIIATFDDGTNPVATAEAYLLVENIPDLAPPIVTITAIDGFGVCSDGTVRLVPTTECADPALEPDFRPGQLVQVDIEVDDDRGLSEVSFKAFGSGVTADDFMLLGAGAHTPGTPLTVSFLFRVNRRVVPGRATVVAQATDTSGNMFNSTAVHMNIDLGIVANGGRTLESVVGGGLVTAPHDVAYDPTDGSILIANRDGADSVVVQVDGTGVSNYATFPAGSPPEFLAIDSAGNLFVTLDNADEVWLVDTDDQSQVRYADAPFGDPEGLAIFEGVKPATGRFIFTGGINDMDCVRLDGVVYEFDTGGGAACAGNAGACGRAEDFCVDYDGSMADAMTQLAAEINIRSTAVEAFEGIDCENSGDDCVFLVANTAGPAVNLTLNVDRGNMTSTDVGTGENASLLHVADRGGGQLIFEYHAPETPGDPRLNEYDLGLNRPRGVVSRMAGAAPARLLVLVVDDADDVLKEFDTGTGAVQVIADDGDGLDSPYGLVITATNCAVISNRGSGTIIGIDLNGVKTPELIATGFDSPRGLALEGSGVTANLLVVDAGFDFVARITPTTSTTDCF
ncbi:MAG: hypothetical protein V3T05_08245, partial [Myxococcota bacterium]